MLEIEAKIRKTTINTFVKLVCKLPHIHSQAVQLLASELCLLIDKEVDKSKEENDIFR